MTAPSKSRLKRYASIFLRWVSIVGVVFVLTFLTGLYVTNNILPKVYTATAKVLLSPPSTTPLVRELGELESPAMLLPVIDDLGLDKVWAERIYQSKDKPLAPVDALAYLQKRLKIEQVHGTGIIAITSASDVPQEAADIANAIADRCQALRSIEVVQAESPDGSNLPSIRHTVSIVSLAVVPEKPTKPNQSFCLLVTTLVAGLLGIMLASFVEVVLLFIRASESPEGEVSPSTIHSLPLATGEVPVSSTWTDYPAPEHRSDPSRERV